MQNKKHAPKGRSAFSRKRRFSDRDIKDIRAEALCYSFNTIAKQFNTTSTHIQAIVDRKIYKDVN